MFCKNCGMELAAGTTFCGNCGTQAEQLAVSQNKITKKKSLIVGVAVSLAVVAVLIIGITLIVNAAKGGSYESVAQKYIKAELEWDFDKAVGYMAIDAKALISDSVNYVVDRYGYSFSGIYEALEEEFEDEGRHISVNSMDDFIKYSMLYAKEEMISKYGSYTVETEVIESRKLSKSEIEDAIETWESAFPYYLDSSDYLDTKKIKDAYEVDIRAEINGKEASKTDIYTITVVKYKGAWKVLVDDESLLNSIM